MASALALGTKPAEAAPPPPPSFTVTPAPSGGLGTPTDLASILLGEGVELAPGTAQVNLTTNPAGLTPSPLPSFGRFSNGTIDLGIPSGLIVTSNAEAESFADPAFVDGVVPSRSANPDIAYNAGTKDLTFSPVPVSGNFKIRAVQSAGATPCSETFGPFPWNVSAGTIQTAFGNAQDVDCQNITVTGSVATGFTFGGADLANTSVIRSQGADNSLFTGVNPDADALGATTYAAGLGGNINNATSLSFDLEPPRPGQGQYLKFEYSLLVTETGDWTGSEWDPDSEIFEYPDGFALFTGGTTPADNCAVVPQTDTYLSMSTAGVVSPETNFEAGRLEAEERLAQRIKDPTAPNGFAYPTGVLNPPPSTTYSRNLAWTVKFLTVPLTCVYELPSSAAGSPVPIEIVIGDLNDEINPTAAIFKADSVRWSDNPTPSAVEPLTVTRSGSGSGTVSSSPAGIDCGQSCAADFNLNSTVTLTADPQQGSIFTGWSGGGCSGTGSCVVTMDQAKSVDANFTASYILAVSKTGAGEVTSSPGGIACGSRCAAAYPRNTVVSLTAEPAPGYNFTGWSGGGCSGTGPCEVTLSENRVVTAQFVRDSYALEVSKQGTGSGTVTSSPSGINCGTTCEFAFEDGAEVTLTASAAGDSTFSGWAGACSGTGPCQVTMDQARQVTATFTALSPPRLSVTKYRPGPRRLNATKIIRLAWVECDSGTCQIDDAEVSFKARGKAFPGSAIYSEDPFQAGERRLISTRVPDEVNERLTSRKSGVAILDVQASARNGELEEQVTRTVRQGLVRCPDSKCG